jgi:nucleotide-binding universal stress UspA family protein
MIKKMADSFHLPVTLLSVDKGDEENEEQVTANRTKLREALPGYDPAYEHISNPDIAAGIVEFALACPSPIVMLIGRKHSFLEGFFHESVTRQLVNRAPVPVLVIPEKEAQLAL